MMTKRPTFGHDGARATKKRVCRAKKSSVGTIRPTRPIMEITTVIVEKSVAAKPKNARRAPNVDGPRGDDLRGNFHFITSSRSFFLRPLPPPYHPFSASSPPPPLGEQRARIFNGRFKNTRDSTIGLSRSFRLATRDWRCFLVPRDTRWIALRIIERRDAVALIQRPDVATTVDRTRAPRQCERFRSFTLCLI